ncbi:MAG: GNAT family N-acetyltransferase [Dehalococcoidia bacterium]
MDSQVNLRRIRTDEGGAYREVRLRALQRAPDAYEITYEESIQISGDEWRSLAEQGAEAMECAIFVLDRGDGVFGGTVFVRVNEQPPYDAFVGAMWVDEDLRGSSVASALLDAAEHFASVCGSTMCELWVEADNIPGRRLYEGHGYAETGVTMPGRRDVRSLLMQKQLLRR